jgi:hypothetical protein
MVQGRRAKVEESPCKTEAFVSGCYQLVHFIMGESKKDSLCKKSGWERCRNTNVELDRKEARS